MKLGLKAPSTSHNIKPDISENAASSRPGGHPRPYTPNLHASHN